MTVQSANSFDPVLVLKNTNTDANGARLRFVKDAGEAGADNDVAGTIEFYADDANQDNILFAKVEGAVKVAADGQEGGKLTFSVASNDGEMQTGLLLADGSAEDEIDVTIGSGADSLTTIAGDLDIPNGGFALGSDADGDIYYRNSSNLQRLAKGDDDQVLTLASGLPSWAAASGGGSASGSARHYSAAGVETSGYLKVTGSSTFAGLLSGSSTLQIVGNAILGGTLNVSGATTLAGDSSLNGAVTINDDGADKDFRVETADESHMIFVEGSSNRMSIGDNTGSPGATLEVKNHASAGAFGVPLVQLNSNDTDKVALDINASNIDANVVDILADSVTTAKVINVSADGLTTGNAFYVDDNSSDTGTRNTALVIQNNAAAIAATALTVQSDGGITGVKLDKNFSGTYCGNSNRSTNRF